MARSASPKKHHSPKDLCSIEQAEYIANLVAANVAQRLIAENNHHHYLDRHKPTHALSIAQAWARFVRWVMA